MEIIECVHKMDMTTGENHTEVGVCRKCGQTVVYDRANLKTQPLITKLGRKDGKIVVPRAGFNTQLSGKDLADLRVANMGPAISKHPMAAKAPAAGIPPRPRGDDHEAQREWYKKYKKPLILELLRLGEKEFGEQYLIPRQLLSHLKSDKYYRKLIKKTPAAPGAESKATKDKPGRPATPKSDKLPQLPEWSSEWAPEVQLLWLRIYEKLL